MIEISQETINGFFVASITITGVICMTVFMIRLLGSSGNKND
jgi:hypothetical protein